MNCISKAKLYQEVAVVVPVKNEALTLPQICKQLKERQALFIIVDDGSDDISSLITREFGGHVCRHEKSLGKGVALQTGFNWILNNTDSKFIAVMDGDGQHLVSDLDQLIIAAKIQNSDFVLGERELIYPMPFVRRITNRVMTSLLNCLSGLMIRDSQCGLRVLSRGFVENYKFKSKCFEIESEMLIAAVKLELQIQRVPIKTIYLNNRESYIRPIRDTFKWLVYLLREILSYPSLLFNLPTRFIL